MNKPLQFTTTLLFFFGLSSYAQAITINFNFTGECDDCAFMGDPDDAGFNPLNDGLTETVSASLSIDGLSVDSNGMIDYLGAGDVRFTYNGSSLINAFTMADPYSFSSGLLTSGAVENDFEFKLSSTQNFSDPGNPVPFDFPDFCTDLGQQVLESGCNAIGDITFKLDSLGNWSIEGAVASDIGGSGQFTVSAVPLPGAFALFASGFLGLIGLMRRRAA